MKLFYVLLVLLMAITTLLNCDKIDVSNSGLSYMILNRHDISPKVIQCGNTNVTLKFRSNNWILNRIRNGRQKFDKDSLYRLLSTRIYFTLSFQRDDNDIFAKRFADYESCLQEISHQLKYKVKLLNKKYNISISPSDMVYPRMYGTTKASTVVLCFEDRNIPQFQEYDIVIEDLEILSRRRSVFKFDKREVEVINQNNASIDDELES